MLSTSELQGLVREVQYKPGWEFKVYDGRHEGQHIVINTVVPDAYDENKNTMLDVHSMLPPMETKEQFYEWVLWRLKRIETHECREFLRIGGKVYSDPHAEFAERDL
jgi:hypothetical protein